MTNQPLAPDPISPVPSAYRDGQTAAARIDPDMAGLYIRNLSIADPLADLAVASLSHLPESAIAAYVAAGLDGDTAELGTAPQPLRDFFAATPTAPPAWWDPELALAAQKSFHTDADVFMESFFTATLRIAATRISKSVASTGAVSSSLGVHRIRHSSHHLFEIMLPGSLTAHRDGWKICVHIRLVHAATRRLILQHSTWDTAELGIPISAAHLALASANYSAGLLQYVRLLGVALNERSRQGFIQIWRYVGTLLGTPAALLFEGSETDILRYREIAERAEPRSDADAIAVTNSVVEVLPHLIGQTDPAARAATVRRTYRLTRALLGKNTADRLRFPASSIPYCLALRRTRQRLRRIQHRLHPRSRTGTQSRHLALLLQYAVLLNLAYLLPPIAPALGDPPHASPDDPATRQYRPENPDNRS